MKDIYVIKIGTEHLVRPATCLVKLPTSGKRKVTFRNLTDDAVTIMLPQAIFNPSKVDMTGQGSGESLATASDAVAFEYTVSAKLRSGTKVQAKGNSAPIIIIDK